MPSETEGLSIHKRLIKKISMGMNLMALYPPSHPEVKSGVSQISQLLDSYFDSAAQEISLGVGLRGWIIESLDLSNENIQFGASARELHRRGISCITFYKGVNEDILLKFFQIATMPPDEINKRGGLIHIASMVPLRFISMFELDYAKILGNNFSEDDYDIVKSPENSQQTIQEYIKKSNDIDTPHKINEGLAIQINRIFKLGDDDHAQSVIEFLKKLGKSCIKEQQNSPKALKNFIHTLSQLPPSLIHQVSSSLSHISAGEELPASTASSEPQNKQQYDPFQNRLLDIFNNFSINKGIDTSQEKKDDNVDTEPLESLFTPSSISGEISSPDYKKFLAQTVRKTGQFLSVDHMQETDPLIAQEVKPSRLKKQALTVVLDLLDLQDIPEDYELVLRILPTYFTYFMKKIDIPSIVEVFLLLEKHTSSHSSDQIREIAFETISKLFSEEVLFELIQKWLQDDRATELETLLMRLPREDVLEQLRRVLSLTGSSTLKSKLSSLISKMVGSDLQQLQEDIKSDEIETVKDTIQILSMIPTDETADILISELNNPKFIVRNKVIDALINHGTTKSLSRIIPLLPKIDDNAFATFVEKTALFGKKELIDDLWPFFSKKDWFNKHYTRRMNLIQSFGEYRNHHSIPLLTDLFQISPFFLKRKNDSFRVAILSALVKIGTRDALYNASLLREQGNTIIQVTGDALFTGDKK